MTKLPMWKRQLIESYDLVCRTEEFRHDLGYARERVSAHTISIEQASGSLAAAYGLSEGLLAYIELDVSGKALDASVIEPPLSVTAVFDEHGDGQASPVGIDLHINYATSPTKVTQYIQEVWDTEVLAELEKLFADFVFEDKRQLRTSNRNWLMLQTREAGASEIEVARRFDVDLATARKALERARKREANKWGDNKEIS